MHNWRLSAHIYSYGDVYSSRNPYDEFIAHTHTHTHTPIYIYILTQDNAITEIPREIANLKDSLIHLDLRKNRLESVPSALGQLLVLRYLNLAENHLATVDDGLQQCAELRELHLNGSDK